MARGVHSGQCWLNQRCMPGSVWASSVAGCGSRAEDCARVAQCASWSRARADIVPAPWMLWLLSWIPHCVICASYVCLGIWFSQADAGSRKIAITLWHVDADAADDADADAAAVAVAVDVAVAVMDMQLTQLSAASIWRKFNVNVQHLPVLILPTHTHTHTPML